MGCQRLTYHQKYTSKTESTPIFEMGGKQGDDYQVFGMVQPGRSSGLDESRHLFNGMEHDGEVSGDGNSYTTEFRQYDPRLGRWKSLDPLMGKYPNQSPYVAFNNNPIYYTDPLGLEGEPVKGPKNTESDKERENFIAGLDPSEINNGQKVTFEVEGVDGETTTIVYTYQGAEKWNVVSKKEGRDDWHRTPVTIGFEQDTPEPPSTKTGGGSNDDPKDDPCDKINCSELTDRRANWDTREINLGVNFESFEDAVLNYNRVKSTMEKMAHYLNNTPGATITILGNVDGIPGLMEWNDEIEGGSRPNRTNEQLAMDRATRIKSLFNDQFNVSNSQMITARGSMTAGMTGQTVLRYPKAGIIYNQVELRSLDNCCGLKPEDLKVDSQGRPLKGHK